MKYFIGTVSLKKSFFLFFFANSLLQGMELQEKKAVGEENKKVLEILKKIPVFKPEDWVKAGISWIHPRHIVMRPDGRGAFFAMPGVIYYVDFHNFTPKDPHPVIEIPGTTFFPLYAVARNGDDLIVVAIGNYAKNQADIIKHCAKCVVAHCTLAAKVINTSHDVFSKIIQESKDFPFAVQAIALNKAGTLLAMCHNDDVEIIDIATWRNKINKFFPRDSSNQLIDVAMNETATCVVILNILNRIHMLDFKRLTMNDSDDNPISFLDLKAVTLADDTDSIQKVCFLNGDREVDLLYVTKLGVVKIIKLVDCLENPGGDVRSHIFSHVNSCERAAVDQKGEHTTIHWTKNKTNSDDIRSQLIIRRENNTAVEEYMLRVPDLPRTYNYVTKMGQTASAPSWVIEAAACGVRVAAITSDGYMSIWELPKKTTVPTEAEARESRPVLAQKDKDSFSRRRSVSSTDVIQVIKKKIVKIRIKREVQ